MALAGGFTEYTPGSGGRVAIFTDSNPQRTLNRDLLVEIYVSSNFNLDGGTLSVEASVQVDPVLATDAHWHELEGLEDVQANKVYRIALRAPHLALNFQNIGTPVGSVYVTNGYIS